MEKTTTENIQEYIRALKWIYDELSKLSSPEEAEVGVYIIMRTFMTAPQQRYNADIVNLYRLGDIDDVRAIIKEKGAAMMPNIKDGIRYINEGFEIDPGLKGGELKRYKNAKLLYGDMSRTTDISRFVYRFDVINALFTKKFPRLDQLEKIAQRVIENVAPALVQAGIESQQTPPLPIVKKPPSIEVVQAAIMENTTQILEDTLAENEIIVEVRESIPFVGQVTVTEEQEEAISVEQMHDLFERLHVEFKTISVERIREIYTEVAFALPIIVPSNFQLLESNMRLRLRAEVRDPLLQQDLVERVSEKVRLDAEEKLLQKRKLAMGMTVEKGTFNPIPHRRLDVGMPPDDSEDLEDIEEIRKKNKARFNKLLEESEKKQKMAKDGIYVGEEGLAAIGVGIAAIPVAMAVQKAMNPPDGPPDDSSSESSEFKDDLAETDYKETRVTNAKDNVPIGGVQTGLIAAQGALLLGDVWKGATVGILLNQMKPETAVAIGILTYVVVTRLAK